MAHPGTDVAQALLGRGASSVGLGAGLDDVETEGEAVDDGGAPAGSLKVFVRPQ